MTREELLRLIGNTNESYIEAALKTRAPEKGLELMKETKNTKGRYAKHHKKRAGLLIAAAVAAAVLAGCAVAAHYYGHTLMDDLRTHTLENPEGYEALLVTAPPETAAPEADPVKEAPQMAALASGKDSVAEYQVLEAILDSESLYLHERIVPLDENVIFIDQLVMPGDPVEMLENPELKDMTVQEYADSQGKTLKYARLVEHFSGDIINGWGYHAMTASDGSLHIYGTGSNPSSQKELAMDFEGFTYAPKDSGPFLDRAKFSLSLEDKSTGTELVFQNFAVWKDGSPDLQKDFGLVIDSLTFKETELGIYATFQYHRNEVYEQRAQVQLKHMIEELPQLEGMGTDEVYLYYICMEDENGESFTVAGPGGGSGIIDNGDGTYSFTDSIPKVNNVANLKFKVSAPDTLEEGIYSFSK